MVYLDEEIAKQLRKERMKEKKEREKQETARELEKLEEEKIAGDMEKGYCTVIDQGFSFARKDILGGRLSVLLPDGNLTVQSNFKELFVAGDDQYEVGFNYVIAEGEQAFQDWEVYKQNMQNGLKESNIRFQWLEEGCVLNRENKLHYLEFLTSTGLGMLHNHMYICDLEEGRLTVNINYKHEKETYWKVLVKIMMEKMQLKR